MKTKLLAEMIFGMAIHGIGSKREIVERIAGDIDTHHEPVRGAYKSEPRTCETCETCGNNVNKFCKSVGCNYGEMWIPKPASPRSVSEEDVEKAIDWLIKAITICDTELGNGSGRIRWEAKLDIAIRSAKETLDRIAGKEESSHD